VFAGKSFFAGLLAALRYTEPRACRWRRERRTGRMAARWRSTPARFDAFTLRSIGHAGLAGVALSQIDNVSPPRPELYHRQLLVVVFGGVGNLWGTLVGAMSLGVANKFSSPYAARCWARSWLLVIVILFIRSGPAACFALKGRAVEA